MKILATLTAALWLVPSAHAKPFGEWTVGGHCAKSNTQLIENGDAVAVLFDDLGVNMPLGQPGDGLQSKRQCHFKIHIEPPAGSYLSGISQTYAGGLIKSVGSTARLAVKYRLGNLKERPVDLDWKSSMAISPEDVDSLFSRSVDEELIEGNCPKRTHFAVTLAVSAQRKDIGSTFVVAGWDTFDVEFKKRVVLVPRFHKCKGRR